MRSCSLFSCGSGVAPVLAHREAEALAEQLAEVIHVRIAAACGNAADGAAGVCEQSPDVFHSDALDLRAESRARDLAETEVKQTPGNAEQGSDVPGPAAGAGVSAMYARARLTSATDGESARPFRQAKPQWLPFFA